MAQTDVLITRTAFRDELRRDLLTRANDFYRDLAELADRPLDESAAADDSNGHAELETPPAAAKVPVLTRRAFLDLVNEIFEIPLPPPSAHDAEVSTPATIVVAAECPKCQIHQSITVKITPELLVDPDGSELRVKAKAKGRVHVCGQLELPESSEADGQQSLELDAVEAGEAIGETLPNVDDILGGELVDVDGDLLPGGPAIECVGSNHVPGCEHTGPVAKRSAEDDADLADLPF